MRAAHVLLAAGLLLAGGQAIAHPGHGGPVRLVAPVGAETPPAAPGI